ncbi:mandelate racemase/muconate lactonizing protein [Pusillimonas sp. T7-7]|uniref:mandelate racemase/muconate lactonizing enzyme family protein n=1 Tax=Pusillimonas sp. (strain T7-7) TaxID=1007105 RepID=UPI00020849F3|nr:mandelate racemase/muconate lactonizing enzyme family protein [Pusillimonas sp. T7-7]AEC19948.1 mandelate racemase/muconate lactonizing protein [Pusillimonas sp. T7-7]
MLKSVQEENNSSMADSDLKIVDIEAFPVSYPLPEGQGVTLGIGRTVKRDAVVVKVTTAGGIVGYGESHHGRSVIAIATLINTTLRHLALGMNADDVVGVWARIYKMQLGSHGMGAATSMAMSGIDQALWDIRGKAVGWPLWKLLGGSRKPIPAYAGGVSLGYQEPAQLVQEAEPLVESGYKAIKLRIGDNVAADIARVAAVRKAFGDELTILTDANCGYTVADALAAMPGLDDNGVGWLEEPFPAHDYRSYREARNFGHVRFASGENHYTRFEFNYLLNEGVVSIWQPDLSKSGGITEGLRIAAMASAQKILINPHSAMSGISMAVTIHFLAAIDNAGYFEADAAKTNFLRDKLVETPYQVDKDGCVLPLNKPGIGVEVDEDFIKAYPATDGPAYV